jgi:hypothetical protein
MNQLSSLFIGIPALQRSSPSESRTEADACRRCVQEHKSDIPSTFVASKCSQALDVQRHWLEDRHAFRLLDAVAD